DGAVEMMHGRVPVVAECEVAELQRGGHVEITFKPSPTTPRPRSPRSRPRPRRGAPAPTSAGSTARSTPADDPRRDDGGGAGGRGSALGVVPRSGQCNSITFALGWRQRHVARRRDVAQLPRPPRPVMLAPF